MGTFWVDLDIKLWGGVILIFQMRKPKIQRGWENGLKWKEQYEVSSGLEEDP